MYEKHKDYIQAEMQNKLMIFMQKKYILLDNL